MQTVREDEMFSRYLCCLCDGFFVLQKKHIQSEPKFQYLAHPKNIEPQWLKNGAMSCCKQKGGATYGAAKEAKKFSAFLKNQEHFVCTYVVDK